jgi:hypothetical protein
MMLVLWGVTACAADSAATQVADHAHLASSSDDRDFLLVAAIFASVVGLAAIALLATLYEGHRDAEDARRRTAAIDERHAAAQARYHAAIDRIDAIREADMRRELMRIPTRDRSVGIRSPHRVLPPPHIALAARVQHDPVYVPAPVLEAAPPPPPQPVYVYPVQPHPVVPTTVTRSAAPLTTPHDEVSRIANEEMRRLRDELAAITAAGDAWLPH